MRIIDFKNFKPMESLLKKMDAKINHDYTCEYEWDHLSEQELELLNTKGIVLDIAQLEKCIQADGSFEWKGQKVLVYIKEQWIKSDTIGDDYKYHIANCRTQINMRQQGRINRYVISTRNDGIFEVTLKNGRNRSLVAENVELPMNVCKNCLTRMLMSHPSKYNFFNYYKFDLGIFLKEYNTKLKYLPKYNNKSVPKDEYPKNWNEISKAFRQRRNWTCEECGLDCKDNKSFLHCHHKGPKYDNNSEKLQVLCKSCHRKKPGHQNMK